MEEPIIVTIQDANVLGYCRPGCFALAKSKGLDWRKFVREGIDSRELAAPGEDSMVDALVEQARRRIREENNGR